MSDLRSPYHVSGNASCVYCHEPLGASFMRTEAGAAHTTCSLGARRKEREAEQALLAAAAPARKRYRGTAKTES
jgi:hypothetical protein